MKRETALITTQVEFIAISKCERTIIHVLILLEEMSKIKE